jgi:hypothetical protein
MDGENKESAERPTGEELEVAIRSPPPETSLTKKASTRLKLAQRSGIPK